jgi:hypothetical protein
MYKHPNTDSNSCWLSMGRIHHLEEGYWIKFEIERVEATKIRSRIYK